MQRKSRFGSMLEISCIIRPPTLTFSDDRMVQAGEPMTVKEMRPVRASSSALSFLPPAAAGSSRAAVVIVRGDHTAADCLRPHATEPSGSMMPVEAGRDTRGSFLFVATVLAQQFNYVSVALLPRNV